MAFVGALLGGALQAVGASKQAKASKKAEEARQQMMNLEAQRKRREIVRDAQMKRAEATVSATSQGAESGSGLAGGLAQVTSSAAINTMQSKQDQELGNKVFEANKKYAKAGALIAFGGGISSLASAFSS